MTPSLEVLPDIEAIKQLKARYFRLMDTKEWAALAEVFTEDCRADYGSDHVDGREQLVKYLADSLTRSVTAHHGHMPEIEVSGSTAKGIWSMYDRVETCGSDLNFRGYGHYIEDYAKDDSGEWRIAHLQLTRLVVEAL